MRLEVTRRAELAVQAVAALAEHGRLKSGALATVLSTTPGFVAQVINPLVKAGFVRSDPGPSGGYALREAGEAATVLDVIEAVDGPTDTGQCVVLDRPCSGAEPCVLHTAWARARHELVGSLAATPAAGWRTQERTTN
ncbi:Rrf2 family transcriptional regulator [Enemella dayhoffiae]|uniref:Rrf2 family transcriptional regulator n=1 Tax=Enemella dayhoffiae TaxID=2016507 RepID=A0A255GLE5_9ACTN|nr:Rrf2 family transcriptional regulator [Enemella dayhoffiae]OYO16658.1 Rrf2 family transcriptional regulator [Enemella dayhoffiae]